MITKLTVISVPATPPIISLAVDLLIPTLALKTTAIPFQPLPEFIFQAAT